VHRILAPQPGEKAVPGVFGIEVRVADVDFVERYRPGIAMRLGLEVDGGAQGGDEVVHWLFCRCVCCGMPTTIEPPCQ
jgi:hypothetical protein